MAAKLDYKKLEKEYLTSNISITKLCEKHKCSKSTVSRYAREHDWENRRTNLAQKRTKLTVDKVNELQKDSWDRLRERMMRILDNELDKFEKGTCEMNLRQVAATVKDMREMGIFGATLSDKKNLAEIKRIEKELSEDDSKDIKVQVVLADSDEYTN